MSENRINPGLANLDALAAFERQALEGRRAQPDGALGTVDAPELAGLALEPQHAPDIDAGEQVLKATAWNQDGPRLLADAPFQPGGTDPASDLALVDQVIASLG